MPDSSRAPSTAGFALTIFISAFLLFQIQPLIAKVVLPWFGGGPAVWTVAMLFFQTGLLAGYSYAHLLRRHSPALQSRIHLVVLLVSVALLPFTGRVHAPATLAPDQPVWHLVRLLVFNIGVPYLALASTAPLLQHWFALSRPGSSPYRLYALSNAGSLLALLTYPFVIEPGIPLRRQLQVWAVLYLVFVGGVAWAAMQLRRPLAEDAVPPGAAADSKLSVGTVLFWAALAATGSALLLSVTNQLAVDVAVVPFLWVLPLSVYLLTFMAAFESDRWYSRAAYGRIAGVAIAAATAVAVARMISLVWVNIAVYAVTLFACCMVCHGELAHSRPAARHLTLYYLVIAAGGAAGGLFVALLAPVLFDNYLEMYLAFSAVGLLGLAAWYRERVWQGGLHQPYRVIAPIASLVLGVVVPITAITSPSRTPVVASARNFYGVLRVSESDGIRYLTHGRVTHGSQFTDARRRNPTTYFGYGSGIALTLRHHPAAVAGRPMRIGVIGLGTGTIASYGLKGDVIRFYELNPDVERIARQYFTYLRDSQATVEVVLGDARIRMEQEAAASRLQNFDVLAIDAFSSDAIPAHLLTAECLEIYRKHLNPGGVLAFHISNYVLDLTPVVRALADRAGWQVVRIVASEDGNSGRYISTWVIIGPTGSAVDAPELRRAGVAWAARDSRPLLWTDDYASVWRILK